MNKAFGQIVPQVTDRSTKVSLNKPAIAEADRTNWYESPSAIVQADRGLKLHPFLLPLPPGEATSALLLALLRSVVPVIQEAKAVSHAEPATGGRQERRHQVRADFDDVIRL